MQKQADKMLDLNDPKRKRKKDVSGKEKQQLSKELERFYYTPGHKLHLASVSRLHRYFKPHLSRADIVKFLEGQYIHQIYKQLRKFPYNKMIISQIRFVLFSRNFKKKII